MKEYKVVCTIPTSHPWEAVLEERYVTAENFNRLLMNYATIEEVKNGVRIVAIYERTDNGWLHLKSERSPVPRKDD